MKVFAHGSIDPAEWHGSMVEVQHISQLQERHQVDNADATPIVHLNSPWLYQDAMRLDASHYSTGATSALLTLESFRGGDISRLADLISDCFVLGRFKRIYATTESAGWPYLSPSETFHFKPTSARWIARKHAPATPEKHFAQSGWILVSASGTVGRPTLATNRLEHFFLSHDLVRIVPSETMRSEYLLTYLSSWIGQALLTKDQYGSAIKHLEAHHVANIPVPLLPDSEMEEVADMMGQAYSLRDEANQLLDDATTVLYRALDLPQFEELSVDYLSDPNPMKMNTDRLQAFAVNISAIGNRLDASFHNPLGATAVKALSSGRFLPTPLGEVCERIFYPGRFRRIYVSEEHGVPFIQGSHISLMRPYNQKYLARKDERNLSRCRVRKNWVLMTCSRTIGRVTTVPGSADGQAASQHLVRLVAREPEYNPGYIALFLMTPYGQHQVRSKIYGAVVDELTHEDLSDILIPDAPKALQDAIGNQVVQAFELKDEAARIEYVAIRTLEDRLDSGLRQSDY